MVRVAINGLGRIGRAALKIMTDIPEIQVVGINDLLDPDNLSYLLKYDTVYGRFSKPVGAAKDALVIGEKSIPMSNNKNPAELPWKQLKVDVVLECTGRFTNKEDLQKHVQAGARYAILSAPAKGEGLKTVVPGVNASEKQDTLFSLASCTTNCIAPVMEVLERRIGVDKAIMSTIHAYTSSQSVVDGPNKKWRRGRAAAMNLVPTSTGAANATSQVVPTLRGLFDGLAIRAPIPVGSISDIVAITKKSTSVDEINAIFREESGSVRYRSILGASDEEIVSSDIIQDTRASIVDLTMTRVVGGNLVKIMSWYDNEWGYASQMVREVRRIGSFL